jgi:putative transposase
MRKTYKTKLYANKKNKRLHDTINLAGRAYNHAIALHRRYYKLTGKYLNQYALMKHFAKLKKRPKYAWLKLIPAQALQDVIQRIEKGYKLFFRNLKHKIKTAPPSFRKIVKFKSFTLKQAGWRFMSERKIRINGHIYKLVNDRLPVGKIKTVTIKRDKLGDLYACFSVELELPQPGPMTGEIAGFDFGLKDFLTVYDGQETYRIESPLFFRQSLRRTRVLNRILSRKKKGSKHRKRAKYNLAREHKRIADKRRDWFFKLAHQLTNEYDVLVFETLNLKGMVKMWGRKVTDLAFGEFLNILQYVASAKGCTVYLIDRFFPSSKKCHNCGHINSDLQLSDRFWRCSGCQKTNDRDGNAAMNIRAQGIESLGLVDVRPVLIGLSALDPIEPHAL